jgi:long-chain acyl-CoA synthetase
MSARPGDPGAVAAVDRPPGVPATYPLPDVPLTRMFEDAVRDAPDAVAVLARGQRRTWAEVAASASTLEDRLANIGVGPSDPVLIAVGDHPDAMAAWWAVWSRGGVAVPVGDVTVEDIDRAPVRAVVAAPDRVLMDDAGVEGPPCVLLDEARDASGPLAPVRSVGRRASALAARTVARTIARARRSTTGPDTPSADPMRAALGPEPAPSSASTTARTTAGLDPSMPAVILPGLDAMGRPRTLTHAQVLAATFQVRLWVPDVQAMRERIAAVDPWTDPAALVAGPLLAALSAGTLVLASAGTTGAPGPDTRAADALSSAVERGVATLAVLPAGVLRVLADRAHAGGHDVTSLRVMLVTGAPLPWHVVGDVVAVTGGAAVRGLACVTGTLPTHAHPVYGRVVAGTVGLPLTGTDSRLGPSGTLEVAGPQLGGTAIDSGLVASVDADGTVTVHGPVEGLLAVEPPLGPVVVEHLLERHPGVERAGVVRVVAGSGGRVVAVLEGPRRGRPTAESLDAYLRTPLGAAAVPDVIVWATVPTSPGGDVDRPALRAMVDHHEEARPS